LIAATTHLAAPFAGVKTAPNAMLLPIGDGLIEALLLHGAGLADLFGPRRVHLRTLGEEKSVAFS